MDVRGTSMGCLPYAPPWDRPRKTLWCTGLKSRAQASAPAAVDLHARMLPEQHFSAARLRARLTARRRPSERPGGWWGAARATERQSGFEGRCRPALGPSGGLLLRPAGQGL